MLNFGRTAFVPGLEQKIVNTVDTKLGTDDFEGVLLGGQKLFDRFGLFKRSFGTGAPTARQRCSTNSKSTG